MRALILVCCGAMGWLAGCGTIGNDVETETTFVTREMFAASERDPELFLGTTLPKRPYRQLALMEITGGDGSTTAELFVTLQREAREIGADAVMDIRKGHRQRVSEFVSIWDDLAPRPEGYDPDANKTEYDAVILTGIAVRYTDRQPGLVASPAQNGLTSQAATPTPTAAPPDGR